MATSRQRNVAQDFAGKNGYVFKIRIRKRGIDVNRTLGDASPFPEQQEVAFPGSIPSSDVMGAWPAKGGSYIPNPNYKPLIKGGQ